MNTLKNMLLGKIVNTTDYRLNRDFTKLCKKGIGWITGGLIRNACRTTLLFSTSRIESKDTEKE